MVNCFTMTVGGLVAEAASPQGSTLVSVQKRSRQALDRCLWALEDAAEHGAREVSPLLAARMPDSPPGIRPGVPLRQAMDIVFKAQERLASEQGARVCMARSTPPSAVDRAAARSLTDRIRRGIGEITLLVLEAHNRRVWRVLGYPTWERYVAQEFGFSRSRSYQLLDHARVLSGVMEAAGCTAVPNISAYAAAQVLRHLPQMVADIRRRVTPRMSEREVLDSIDVTVRLWRQRARIPTAEESSAGEPADGEVSGGLVTAVPAAAAGEPDVDASDLVRVLGYLANLPPTEDVLQRLRQTDAAGLSLVRSAAERLEELARAWECAAARDESPARPRIRLAS